MYFMEGSITLNDAYQTTHEQRKSMMKTVSEIIKKKNKASGGM